MLLHLYICSDSIAFSITNNKKVKLKFPVSTFKQDFHVIIIDSWKYITSPSRILCNSSAFNYKHKYRGQTFYYNFAEFHHFLIWKQCFIKIMLKLISWLRFLFNWPSTTINYLSHLYLIKIGLTLLLYTLLRWLK